MTSRQALWALATMGAFVLLSATNALADTYMSGMACDSPNSIDDVLDWNSDGQIETTDPNNVLVCDLPAAYPEDIYYARVLVKNGFLVSTIACSMTVISTYEGSIYTTTGTPDTSLPYLTYDYLYVYPPSSPGVSIAAYVVCDPDYSGDAIKAIWVNE